MDIKAFKCPCCGASVNPETDNGFFECLQFRNQI